MRNAWKISGYYLFVISLIHSAFGLFAMQDVLRELWNEGLIGSISGQMDRNAVFWFLSWGFLLGYIGVDWQQRIRRHKEPLSKFSAWGLAAIVVSGILIMPASGFWLGLPLCLIMLWPHYFSKTDAKRIEH